MSSHTIKQACTRPFHTSFDKLLNNLSIRLGNGDKLSQLTVFVGLQSKRPQVKTSPSQNVPKLVKTSPKVGQNVPMVKNVGQNVPKMIFILYFTQF